MESTQNATLFCLITLIFCDVSPFCRLNSVLVRLIAAWKNLLAVFSTVRIKQPRYEKNDCIISAVISDKVLHKIARMIGAKRLALGLELDLESAVIETLESEHREPADHAFYILKVSNRELYKWLTTLNHVHCEQSLTNNCCSQTWREMTGNKSEKEQVDMLEEALREIGRNDLQSYIGR